MSGFHDLCVLCSFATLASLADSLTLVVSRALCSAGERELKLEVQDLRFS